MSKAILIAWSQAAIDMIGSLYFSEVLKYPPCPLCWYQRICIYPLTVILLVGWWRKNREIYLYVLPLSIIGWLISIWHNLLYFLAVPVLSCSGEISCTTENFQLFGFLTISMLSTISFTIINGCMIFARKCALRKTAI